MPGHELFRKLGLFVIPQFLDEPSCQELIALITAAPKRPGATVGGGGTKRVDETRRSVGDAKVPDGATAELKQSLLNLRPDLEKHFKMPLEWGGEGPDYLYYQAGDFFKPHRDNEEYPPAPNSRILRRRVAVILFLNRYSRELRENCFGGGLLNFYGLLDGPQWEQCPLGMEAEPGLLVGFPANLLHEVTPVTYGERYSILTGFHAPQPHASPTQQ